MRANSELQAEILDLQQELRAAAAQHTEDNDVSRHLTAAKAVGDQLSELFRAGKDARA